MNQSNSTSFTTDLFIALPYSIAELQSMYMTMIQIHQKKVNVLERRSMLQPVLFKFAKRAVLHLPA